MPDELKRKQGHILVKHSDIVRYIILNGVACIIAERSKESMPLRLNTYLVLTNMANFQKGSKRKEGNAQALPHLISINHYIKHSAHKI